MALIEKDLGRVSIVPKGEYNASTDYVRLDVVQYQGSAYIAIASTKGNLPTDTNYWQLLASKGSDGTMGTTPVRGTDYWTESDKTEIVQEVLAALPAAEEVSF